TLPDWFALPVPKPCAWAARWQKPPSKVAVVAAAVAAVAAAAAATRVAVTAIPKGRTPLYLRPKVILKPRIRLFLWMLPQAKSTWQITLLMHRPMPWQELEPKM